MFKSDLFKRVSLFLQLFDEVVSILDPDMSVSDASALPTLTGDGAEEENGIKTTEPSKKDVNRATQSDGYYQYNLNKATCYFSIIVKQPR